MKILLAVDGSPFTKKMLAWLVNHDEMIAPTNEFTALTIHPSLPPRARSAVGNKVVQEWHEEGARKVLDPVVKFLGRHGHAVKMRWEVGQPGDQIAKAARTGDYDLVVMGSHGHGALANLVMGSVATQVLARCEVPVLMIR